MELFKWSGKMSVGIQEIDDQHQNLINIINKLFKAMLAGKAQKIINEIVDELIEYADYHFDTEEKYFDQHGYPDSHQHTLQHSFYKDEILLFKKEILNGKSTVPMQVFNFLKDWLTNHIMKSDKKYAEFLENKN